MKHITTPVTVADLQGAAVIRDTDDFTICVDHTGTIDRMRDLAQAVNLHDQLMETIEKFYAFAEEVLPQAGKLCFDLGNLNAAMMATEKIRRALAAKEKEAEASPEASHG